MIGDMIGLVGNVIDKIFPNKAQADKAKLKLLELEQSGDLKQLEYQSQIVQAEAKSENKLTSSWRPILMYIFMLLLLNNYIFVPYLEALGLFHVKLELPVQLWHLLEFGVGGYIVGRSGEKVVGSWKKQDGPS